jgi:5-methylcytosine-specific restriction endonuclease McrA
MDDRTVSQRLAGRRRHPLRARLIKREWVIRITGVRSDIHPPSDISLFEVLQAANLSDREVFSFMERFVQRRETRYQSVRAKVTDTIRREIRKRDGNRCTYCRRLGTSTQGPDGRRWHVDHRIPVSRGGTSERSNLALACASCNITKADLQITQGPA